MVGTHALTRVDRLMLPLLAHWLQAVSIREQEGLMVTLAISEVASVTHTWNFEHLAQNALRCAPYTLRSS